MTSVSIMLAALSVIVLIMTITIIIMTYNMSRMEDRMNDLSSMMYSLLKKNNISLDNDDQIKHALTTINTNIGSLSSSTLQGLEEIKKDVHIKVNKKYFPTPNISKMMRETIMECITIEVLLNKDLKIPNPNSVDHIVQTVLQTYPDVNIEYATKLTFAMIENYTEEVQEQQLRQQRKQSNQS